MSDPPQAGPASRPPNQSARPTVSRPAGLLIAAATAGAVFAAGVALGPFAPVQTNAPRPVGDVAPMPPPPVAAPPPKDATDPTGAARPRDGAGFDRADGGTEAAVIGPAADGATAVGSVQAGHDSGVVDALAGPAATVSPSGAEPARAGDGHTKKHPKDGATGSTPASAHPAAADAPARSRPDADRKRDNAPLPPSDGTAVAGDAGQETSDADCALPDKDMSRQAWRRNRPALCLQASAGKSFILIPIKGPIEGEVHALIRRPVREARVTLPRGTESLLTMKQYKVHRLGFKELWVSPIEDGVVRLKIKLLPGAGDPVFEVRDGYVKVTIAPSDGT